jgi:hypothetical protein
LGTLEELQAHPAFIEIMLRSTTRSERYRILWCFGENRSHPVVAEPWSAEAEIEALRSEVAISWERRGLALVLDALTPDDLTIISRLLFPDWFHIVRFATLAEIEQVLAKVQLDARAATTERNESGFPVEWEELRRPLTWADVNLDPATFPWWYRRQWEQARPGEASSWWRSKSRGRRPGHHLGRRQTASI